MIIKCKTITKVELGEAQTLTFEPNYVIDLHSTILDNEYLQKFRDLWQEVHTKENPTQEWFNDWVNRIPNIVCGCRKWVLDYIKTHEPALSSGSHLDWHSYTFKFHNAVNTKLNKPQFTWEEYCEKYHVEHSLS